MFDRRGNRKYLNSAEREAFRLSSTAESDLAEETFCLTLLYTGCRISEALNVPCRRLDLSERALIFETLKRRHRGMFRAVPMPDFLVKSIQQLVVGKKPTARIWDYSRTTAWRLIKGKMARAEIKGVQACPKGLRHGFAIACLSENIPLTTVKKWLGHARLETSAIYLEVGGNEERQFAKRLWQALE